MAIEWSICTDERPSDTNQSGTIKNLKGLGGGGRGMADRVGGSDRDREVQVGITVGPGR